MNSLRDQLVQVIGEERLIATLERLANKDANRISRKAINAGSREMRDEIKFQIKPAVTRGHSNRKLKANVGARLKKNRKANTQEAISGLGVGKRKQAAGPVTHRNGKSVGAGEPHFHLVALGSRPRWTGSRTRRTRTGEMKVKKTGNAVRYRGRMPADDFVGRAYRARGSKAVGVMVETLRSGIEAAAVQ